MTAVEHPISVLHFTNSTARGGVEEHILQLLSGLDPQRFVQRWVCSPETAALVRPDVPDGVELIPLHFRKPAQWRGAFSLARILKSARVDILHSHLFYSSLFASPVGRLRRVPVIVETPHVRESWRTGSFKSHFLVDRVAGWCVDRYIGVSHANAEYLRSEKGLPAKKIFVIQNGCDLERFARPAAAPAWREELGFGAGDPVLLVVARLAPQKGHANLIQALPAIRTRFPNVRLVCAGDGELRSELETLVEHLGLAGTVRFVGHQGNVAEWFAGSDITVLPSLYEGLPLVAIESLAAGCPVVATAVDGTPEVVVHGKTGFCVPAGDANALASAICDLLVSPELRRQFGRDGAVWARERFSKERQLEETQNLYQYLWDRSRRNPTGRRTVSEGPSYSEPAGLGKPASRIV